MGARFVLRRRDPGSLHGVPDDRSRICLFGKENAMDRRRRERGSTPPGAFDEIRPIALFGIVLISFVAGFAGQVLAGGPVPGRVGVGAGGDMTISAEDRCPVCAMLPMRYPRFAAAIELQGGMLNAWLNPDIFLGTEAGQLKRPLVREYLSGQTLDAREVIWVSGSDVVGPMGPALIPLKGASDLEAFRRRHGAKHVFRLEELTHDTWQILTGRQAPPR